MAAKKETLPENNHSTAISSIDQIRDIILGEHIDVWEQRFSELENQLLSLQKSTSEQFDHIKQRLAENASTAEIDTHKLEEQVNNSTAELRQLIEQFNKELNEQVKNLGESKVDKDSIGEVFIQWGQRVKSKA